MAVRITAMTWWDYVERTAPGETQEQIARKTDVATPTVGRWKQSTPKPDSVAAFARAYRRPVLKAFVAAGFLTADEAGAQVVIEHAEDPSDEELLDLIARRLRRDSQESEPGRESAPTTRPDVALAAMSGVPQHMPDTTTGEEPQDPGGDEPA